MHRGEEWGRGGYVGGRETSKLKYKETRDETFAKNKPALRFFAKLLLPELSYCRYTSFRNTPYLPYTLPM